MVLVFDLDDTLYDELSFVRSGLEAVAAHGQTAWGIDEGISRDQLGEILRQEGRGRVFDNWLLEHNAFTKARVAQCVAVYRRHKPTLTLFAEAHAFLSRYSSSFRLYLVTDGNKIVQKNKVEALKLSRYFQRVFLTHNFGLSASKPSLRCFEIIRRIENCSWDEIVYVGDNPAKDFVGLNRVGARTVRVRTGNYASVKAPSDFDAAESIPTLSSLPHLLGLPPTVAVDP